jgi:hypothetical protein
MAYKSSMWKKPRFMLIHSESGKWWWTAVLPTQLHKHATRKEALESLATVLTDIRTNRAEYFEHNRFDRSETTSLAGGLAHILSHIVKSAKRKTKKAVKKPTKKKHAATHRKH